MKNSITPRAKQLIHKSNSRSLQIKKPLETLKITVQLISPKHQKSKTMPIYSTPCTTHASSSCSDDPFHPFLKSPSLVQKTQLRPDDFIEPIPDLSIPSLETYNQFKKPLKTSESPTPKSIPTPSKISEKPLKSLKKNLKPIIMKPKSSLTSRIPEQKTKTLKNNQRIILIKPKRTA
jgi:hypothetical protein